MKTIIMAALLTLLSCNSSPSHNRSIPVPYRNVDSRAIEYVQNFERYFGYNLPNIIIVFKDLKKTKEGQCWVAGKKKGLIEIDEGYWNKKSNFDKEEVIFHELGHCILGLPHSQEIIPEKGCPFSLMYYRGVEKNRCYERYHSYYIMELFFRSQNVKQIYFND